MELEDLKNMWIQYDMKLSENTRLNKEILKRMLISKTENRLNRIKIKEGFNLILLPILLIYILPKVDYQAAIGFYVGVSLFGILCSISYFLAVKYFILTLKIDFTNPITFIKKDLNELEKYKIKIKKIAYIFMPLAVVEANRKLPVSQISAA